MGVRQTSRPSSVRVTRRGLAVILDVVYNHFGPEGNYLGLYAPDFFDPSRHTPWGAAINLEGPRSATVRAFFVENALFWLEEYRMDGLRLDAVHALHDESSPNLLEEIATQVQAGPGAVRRVHLVVENDANEVRYLRPGPYGPSPLRGAVERRPPPRPARDHHRASTTATTPTIRIPSPRWRAA